MKRLDCRQRLDLAADFLPGQPDFIDTLQIEPELSAGPKEMPQTQRGVARNLSVPEVGS
jgi:hypothetical protein